METSIYLFPSLGFFQARSQFVFCVLKKIIAIVFTIALALSHHFSFDVKSFLNSENILHDCFYTSVRKFGSVFY